MGLAYSIVTTIVNTIVKALQNGERIQIEGFGIFEIVNTNPKRKYQASYTFDGSKWKPSTKQITESVKLRKKVIFKPSKVLTRYINGTQ